MNQTATAEDEAAEDADDMAIPTPETADETPSIGEIKQQFFAYPLEPIIAARRQGGADIEYLRWHDVVRILNETVPAWHNEIVRTEHIAGYVCVTARITIETADGSFSHEALGNEKDSHTGYGDPFSNASAMALKRAAAMFGLGLPLYKKEDKAQPASRPLAARPPAGNGAKAAHPSNGGAPKATTKLGDDQKVSELPAADRDLVVNSITGKMKKLKLAEAAVLMRVQTDHLEGAVHDSLESAVGDLTVEQARKFLKAMEDFHKVR